MRLAFTSLGLAAAFLLATLVVPTPASAGPGLGGGYEKAPKRAKPVKRRKSSARYDIVHRG